MSRSVQVPGANSEVNRILLWVKEFRLQGCWSQEQIAEMAGLSVGTIQGIESGQQHGFESSKALASVFELNIDQLQQKQSMGTAGDRSNRDEITADIPILGSE